MSIQRVTKKHIGRIVTIARSHPSLIRYHRQETGVIIDVYVSFGEVPAFSIRLTDRTMYHHYNSWEVIQDHGRG